MTDQERARCAERLRAALHLFEVGVDLKRCQLKRQCPDLGTEEIDRLLRQWMLDRPGEQDGSCRGKPRNLSRVS